MVWLDIPKESYDKILNEIKSADSPVGIDAKKTHVMILYKLEEIEKRLTEMENKLQSN